MTNVSNNIYFWQILILSATLGFLLTPTFAKEKALPKYEKCNATVYLSAKWNPYTVKEKSNNPLGFKKLICKTGREAYLVVRADKAGYIYELVNHKYVKISTKDDNMCYIIDRFCGKN